MRDKIEFREIGFCDMLNRMIAVTLVSSQFIRIADNQFAVMETCFFVIIQFAVIALPAKGEQKTPAGPDYPVQFPYP